MRPQTWGKVENVNAQQRTCNWSPKGALGSSHRLRPSDRPLLSVCGSPAERQLYAEAGVQQRTGHTQSLCLQDAAGKGTEGLERERAFSAGRPACAKVLRCRQHSAGRKLQPGLCRGACCVMQGELGAEAGEGGWDQMTVVCSEQAIKDLELGPIGPEGSLVGNNVARIRFF